MSAAQPGTRKLLIALGVGFGLAVTIGNTIGAGILRTPGVIASQLPTFWPYIVIWLLGGLYALLGGNALAELGTMIPRSGGQYVFVRRGLGEYPAFIVGWSDWLSTCGTCAAVAIVVGEYAVDLLPATRADEAVALAVLGAFTIVQWFGIHAGKVAQNVTSLIKALALFFLVGVCFYFGTRSPLQSAVVAEREGSLLLPVILALQAVIYTYDGWSAPIYFSEEMRDSGKSIPRSIFGGIVLIILIYVLINIAFLCVVPLPTLAGEKLAAGVVVERLFGYDGHSVLRALAILILLSALNSNVLMASRVIFAMSTDGLFWRAAREVNRGGTPDVALLVSSLLAAAFIVTGTFEQVIAKLSFFFVANYTLSFLTLFVLRRKEPETARPYRAWGHPWTTGIALIASAAFLILSVASDTRNSLYSIGILFLSFPLYVVLRRMRRNDVSI